MSSSSLSRLARVAAVAMFAALMPISAAYAVDEHYIKDGAVIGGYDVVAYHTVGAPTLGSKQFAAEYQGATWHFASAANRDMFAANPVKFAPAYGGWCSAGASKAKKVMINPNLRKIVDGQLYLNSTEAAHKNLFLADTANVVRKGESNWKNIFATKADKL